VIETLDLFSGIGGFSRGLESTGHFRTIGFCEIESFPREVLRHHWPGVPVWEDVRELTAESLGGLRPDAIVGGFPCQDISVAGKGAGIEGSRSGLWGEFARLVVELRPRWVIGENVGALRTRGIDRVCSDLEAEGYSVWPLVVGAWAVGAPHRRDRVWIVGHSRLEDGHPPESHVQERELDTVRPGWTGAEGLSHSEGERRSEQGQLGDPSGSNAAQRNPRQGAEQSGGASGICWPARPGEPQHEWEEPRLAYGPGKPLRGTGQPRKKSDPGRPQLPVGGSVDGLPVRLARRWNREALKALGNSVVSQVVAVIGQAIAEVDND